MKAILRLAAKDLRSEMRGREVSTAMIVLAFLGGIVGAFAMGNDAGADGTATVLWITVAFATMLGVARATAAEVDRGTWDVLLSLPIDRGQIFVAKTVANAVLVLVSAAVVIPTFWAFGGPLPDTASLARLAPVLILAVIGLSMMTTVIGVIALQTRGREALVPVLLAPVLAPLLFTAVSASIRALDGAAFSALRGELTLMAGYDIAFFALAWLLFERAVEA